MAKELDTPYGDALPPFPPHSITVHVPKWSTILQFVENPMSVMATVKSTYPRFGPFGHVKDFIGRVSSDCLEEGQICLLFGSKDSAEACYDFVLSEKRKEHQCKAEEVKIKAFDFRMRLWATVFPAAKMMGAVAFWQDPGTGISSRIAQDCLNNYNVRKEVENNPSDDKGLSTESQAYAVLKDRIAGLLNRAPLEHHPVKVEPEQVYLYPTGMSTIYHLNRYLQRSSIRSGSTVLFGFAFHSTPHVFKEYSPTFKWFGRGDEKDFDQLEEFCSTESEAGRQVQAVWLEFPTNPNLRTIDITRLRALADKYEFILIIDDTISSFCNVDLLGVADVILTSLTKSFSGYSDVMGGSIVLNSNSTHYRQLKEVVDKLFVNEFFSGDAEALEQNSMDYLERSKRLNDNALALVNYLDSCVKDPSSAVSKVAYPSVGPGAEFYKACMRPETPEFKPGYGCLFSVEIESIESTIAFYDNLYCHNGPHLGANLTLVMPYVKALHSHASEVEWVQECGLNERMIRVSVGLEETEELMLKFKTAVSAADAVKKKDPVGAATKPIG